MLTIYISYLQLISYGDFCLLIAAFVLQSVCLQIEAGTLKYFVKKVLLKISQISQGSTCAGISFLIKMQGSGLHFYLKETPTQVFSCEFCEIFKSTFSIEHLRWLLLYLHHVMLRESFQYQLICKHPAKVESI